MKGRGSPVEGAIYELREGQTRIGRDPHNDIVLEDDTISIEHAVIEIRDGRYWIEDRRSTNGTRLEHRRLEAGEPAQLRGGDRIRFAEIELMFVLAGYLPGGATVFLRGTGHPPDRGALDPSDRGPGRASEPSWPPLGPTPDPELPVAQNVDRAPPAKREGMGMDTFLDPGSAGPEVCSTAEEPERRAVSALPDPEARLFRSCLDFHLERVEEISPAFSAFVARAFDAEIRGAFSMAARDLVLDARKTGSLARTTYTQEGVRFLLCGVAGEMDRAREEFVASHGGFTRLLTEEVASDSFRRDRCEILAVLTFGRGTGPWVSLSIVPEEGHEPPLDLLSYEFLTAEERREIEPSAEVELSQSGSA